jgi:hypothetical protein
VGQQDHQHLPAALDTALAQLVGQLRAGELSPAPPMPAVTAATAWSMDASSRPWVVA